MNSLAKTENHAPATQGDVDPFLSYGQETTTGTPFLKFIKIVHHLSPTTNYLCVQRTTFQDGSLILGKSGIDCRVFALLVRITHAVLAEFLLQFLAGQPQAAFCSRGGCFHHFGHFRQGEPGGMMQREGQPLLG